MFHFSSSFISSRAIRNNNVLVKAISYPSWTPYSIIYIPKRESTDDELHCPFDMRVFPSFSHSWSANMLNCYSLYFWSQASKGNNGGGATIQSSSYVITGKVQDIQFWNLRIQSFCQGLDAYHVKSVDKNSLTIEPHGMYGSTIPELIILPPPPHPGKVAYIVRFIWRESVWKAVLF